MKLKYFLASCLLGAGVFTSCSDEFKDINSSESDISTPNARFLFAECLREFEPMDYSAWFYDFPRMATWSQCIVSPGGNLDQFNMITEQGSMGSHVYKCLRMVNDLRYQISQMSEEEKAKNEYMQYLCNPLVVFLVMNDTDMYGSRQYSEAEQARYTNPPIFMPKYDTQEELVDIMLNELDASIKYLSSHEIHDVLGIQDFIYKGDVQKWAKLANSLKLKIAARLINKDRAKAIKIVNDAVASPVGFLSSADDDFIYNRGKNDNHWNNDFPNGAGSEAFINFLKKNKDTRLLSAFTKNQFNAPVIQAFLDQNKELPPYIAENADIKDGQFLGWKKESMGEPWVRYYGIPLNIGANLLEENKWYFDPTGLLFQLQSKAGGKRNYNPISYRNQELVKGIYDFTYPDAPDVAPDKDILPTPWYGIFFSAAEVNLLLAEFNLLGANTPKTAQAHLTDGVRLSAYVYDKAAELNQVPYYKRACVNDKGDALIKINDEMVDEMLTHEAFNLTGDKKADLEKVYLQQYVHYFMNPIDQFVNVRRSGVPMKGSELLPWQDFDKVINYTPLIPRRSKMSEPAPTDKMHDITLEAIKAQGFSYGSDNADPELLNTQRVWYDQENPQFGEGPKM